MSAKRLLQLACLGLAPMVIGHAGAFVLTAPDAQARDALLASTGHAGFHLLTAFALVATSVGTIQLFLKMHPRSRSDGGPLARIPSVGSLVLIQSVLFVGLELVERIASGQLAGIFNQPAFFVGLVLQVFTALILVMKLRVIRSVVARLSASRREERGESRPGRPTNLVLTFGDVAACISRRGPPLVLSC